MKKIKLFCFPYGGASANCYKPWEKYFNNISLIFFEYAGRGKRINEPLYNDMNEAINDIYNIIKNQIGNEPYAFFGHSLGAIISFELTKRIQQNNELLPSHLFLSGRSTPYIPDRKKICQLPKKKFLSKIIELGGTPPELFTHKDLYDLFFPILKNDIKISEFICYKNDLIQVNCNIVAFFGINDVSSNFEESDWRVYTSKQYQDYLLEGGHFFINEPKNIKKISDVISHNLSLGEN